MVRLSFGTTALAIETWMMFIRFKVVWCAWKWWLTWKIFLIHKRILYYKACIEGKQHRDTIPNKGGCLQPSLWRFCIPTCVALYRPYPWEMQGILWPSLMILEEFVVVSIKEIVLRGLSNLGKL
jgi:hypothetical protein